MKGDDCVCQINTLLVETTGEEGKKIMVPKLGQKQNYQKCSSFKEWQMPKGNIELESKIDILEETYGKTQSIEVVQTV